MTLAAPTPRPLSGARSFLSPLRVVVVALALAMVLAPVSRAPGAASSGLRGTPLGAQVGVPVSTLRCTVVRTSAGPVRRCVRRWSMCSRARHTRSGEVCVRRTRCVRVVRVKKQLRCVTRGRLAPPVKVTGAVAGPVAPTGEVAGGGAAGVPDMPTGAGGVAPTGGPAGPITPVKNRLMWGAWIDGEKWGLTDAPWDSRTVARFTSDAGRTPPITHWGAPWRVHGVPQPFHTEDFEKARAYGSIPLISWGSSDLHNFGFGEQPVFALSRIIRGDHDGFIRAWAEGARAWGHPFFLRFDHEMNGDWYPWSEARNGNGPGEFIRAWRRVHGIFEQVGATNVTWVWSPNHNFTGSQPLEQLYPGDAYVDWIGLSGYSWGTLPVRNWGWFTFDQIFAGSYRELGQLAPSKPILITETAASEFGGSKAAWIADMVSRLTDDSYRRIRGFVWMNDVDVDYDWRIDTSVSARDAFRRAVANPAFLTAGWSAASRT